MLNSQHGVSAVSAAGQPTVQPDFCSSLFGKIPNVDGDGDVDIDVNVNVDANVDVNVGVNVDIHCISATNFVNVKFNLNTLPTSSIFGPFFNSQELKNCDRSLRAMEKDLTFL